MTVNVLTLERRFDKCFKTPLRRKYIYDHFFYSWSHEQYISYRYDLLLLGDKKQVTEEEEVSILSLSTL